MSATATREVVEQLVRSALRASAGERSAPAPVDGYRPNLVVNISARHAHLTREHVEILFGPGAQLTEMRRLYQSTDFASNETVAVVGPRQRMIPGVRILGPCRKFSQVELSFTDAVSLGLDLPVRLSGDIDNTPGCLLIGPHGSLVLERGVIRAERHVHMGPLDASYYGVEHLDRMDLGIEGACSTVLKDLLVRIHKDWKLEVHIDTDEANASDLTHARHVTLKKSS